MDPDHCNAPSSQSLYLNTTSPVFFYSYGTCTEQELLADITWKGGDTPIDLLALGCPAGFAPTTSEDAQCQEQAIGALGNLPCDNGANMDALAAAGGITLLKELAHSPHEAVRTRARHALVAHDVDHWGRSRAMKRWQAGRSASRN